MIMVVLAQKARLYGEDVVEIESALSKNLGNRHLRAAGLVNPRPAVDRVDTLSYVLMERRILTIFNSLTATLL